MDTSTREVRRCGQRVDIRPRELDLLIHLIAHRDHVVSKDELIETVWGGTIVSDSALFSCVKRVRVALRGGSTTATSDEEMIRSVYGHGYCFRGDVREALPANDAATVAPTTARRDQPAPTLATGARDTAASEPAQAAQGSDYVGRDDLMQRLLAHLNEARKGKGRLVMLAGDPGIGKTRTATELMRFGETAGFDVLLGRCLDGGAGQAFWPWTQILRGYATVHAEATVRAVFGPEAAHIRLLTPAAAAAALPSAADVAVDAALLRTRLFDAVIAVLRRAAIETRPLLLVLDDLHWADPSSLALLAALVDAIAQVPILVLATYRDAEIAPGHPLTHVVQQLKRAELGELVHLHPLDDACTRRLLATIAGAELTPGPSDLVVRTSEGNPFFVGEIWYHLIDEGRVVNRGGRWVLVDDRSTPGISEGVRMVLGQRLLRLGDTTRAALAVAAVIGREFAIDQLERITGMPTTALADAIDAADGARLVTEVPGTGRYRFVHALVHATAYEEISSLRRALLHRRVAEDLAWSGLEESLPEIARHYLAAAHTGELEPVIDNALRAGRRALGLLAYDEAIGWQEQALRCLDAFEARIRSASERSRVRCEVLLALGEALQIGGHGERAREVFESVAVLARRVALPQALARAALGMTTQWSYDDPKVAAALEDALAALGQHAPALRVQVLGALAISHYHGTALDGRSEAPCEEAVAVARRSGTESDGRSPQVGEEAIAIARGLGDSAVLMQSLGDWLASHWYSDNLTRQLAVAEELLTLAERSGDRRRQAVARGWALVASLGLGDVHTARRQSALVSELAEELRDPTLRWHALRFRACLTYMAGDLAAAEALSLEAFQQGSRVSERGALLGFSGHVVTLRREQGRIAELLPALRAPTYADERFNNLRVTLPYLLAETGAIDEARTEFQRVVDNGFADVPPENSRNTRLFALGALSEACIATGSIHAAAALYELTRPYRDQWIVVGWGIICLGPMGIVVGVLEGMLGMWEKSQATLESALAAAVAQEAPVAQTVILFGHARMLLTRGRDGDHARAIELVGRASLLCERYGLAGWTTKLERLRAQATAAR